MIENNEMKEMEKISEEIKIENDKLYKGSIIKKMFKNATTKTLANPTGKIEKLSEENREKAESPQFQISMMLSGMILFHELENNLFEKEEE